MFELQSEKKTGDLKGIIHYVQTIIRVFICLYAVHTTSSPLFNNAALNIPRGGKIMGASLNYYKIEPSIKQDKEILIFHLRWDLLVEKDKQFSHTFLVGK